MLGNKDFACVVGARGRRGGEQCSLGKEGHSRNAARVLVRRVI